MTHLFFDEYEVVKMGKFAVVLLSLMVAGCCGSKRCSVPRPTAKKSCSVRHARPSGDLEVKSRCSMRAQR